MTDYNSMWLMLAEQDFEQRWLDVDGVRTRVAISGPADGHPVVLLHGTGGHWETFAPTIGALSPRYRCVAIDMIGNGFTDKPDYDYEIAVYIAHVRGVLDLLGISHAHFIGMSLGAWVSAKIAQIHPELVDRLILMSPAGLIATKDNMARIRAERTKAVENPEWDSIKAMFDHLIADEERRLPDLVGLRQAIYRRPDTLATIDHLLALQNYETRERNLLSEDHWRQIQAPTMVVASGKDHGEYQSTARQVAALIPDSVVFEMPNVRHWPHFEDPDAFNSAALAFLAE
ncbi:alpha/beta fold hydrolase [Microbacterium aurantiacum]|uniref:Alpha/beta hydrolase n=1 Tax=Microbacterium aurantiacum TaxID=162393 RepID=A0ABT8FVZ6_9MICO|nr:alpha/beta hydrolase [Microbacterium aurantiacum]MDN4465355.1 alpha/beta hydrolase [Microbacterium aurantiacum]